MVAVLPAEQESTALRLLAGRQVPAWRVGDVRAGGGEVTLAGAYLGAAANWR